MMKMIKNIDDTIGSVAIFGHNPEFLNLVNYLTTRTIEKFPTCAVYMIEFPVDSWERVARKKGKMIFSDRPKNHF